MASRLIYFYRNMVRRRPFVSQVVTAGVLTSTGDAIAQIIEQRSTGYDIKRTAVMSICGFCYFGPVGSSWLMFLKWLNLRSVALTVAIDQVFAAPAILAGFICIHPVLSGKEIAEAKIIFKSSYWDILKTGWMVWTPAQTINFMFVPFEFRMLYIQSVSVLWNTFLSYRSHISLEEIGTFKNSNTALDDENCLK